MKHKPSLPWGVENPHAADQGLPPEQQGGSIDWVDAPPTSHILAFHYQDVRENAFLRHWPGRLGQGVSLLVVTFKDKGGVGPTYVYGTEDPDKGRAIFEELKAAEHPYGGVLHPKVIQGKWPYYRA